MTTDPTAADQTPLNQGPADNQTDELPDNGLADAGLSTGAGGQVNSVDTAAFTERGDEAETSAFQEDGEYSGGEFAGGDTVRNG